ETVDLGVDLDSGQTRSQRRESLLDASGDIGGVGLWEPVDREHEARTAGQDSVTDEGVVVLSHSRDVAQAQAATRAVNGHRGQVLRRRDRQHMLDLESLRGGVDEPTCPGRRGLDEGQRGPPQRVAGAVDDLADGHAVLAQPRRVYLYLQLPISLAPDRHVRYTGHPQQARFDLPAREPGQADRGRAL